MSKSFLIKLTAASAMVGMVATAYGQAGSLSGSVDSTNGTTPAAGSFSGTLNGNTSPAWTSSSPGTAPMVNQSVSPGSSSVDRSGTAVNGGVGASATGTFGSPLTTPAAPGTGAGIGSDASRNPANGVGTGIGSSAGTTGINGTGNTGVTGGMGTAPASGTGGASLR